MIQRVQTIYLLLAFICTSLLLAFPIFTITAENGGEYVVDFGAYGLHGDGVEASFPIYLMFMTSALFSIAAVLMYKRRPRQLMIARLNLIIHALITVGIYTFYYMGESYVISALSESAGTNPTMSFDMAVGFYLLIPPLAFIWLAIRGIKRDEELVRSLDRLR